MFWAPCGSGGGGWMDGGEGWLGGAPHTCAHARTCTRMRVKHDNFMQMAAPIGGILGIPYDVICACACVHVFACACVGGTLSPPPPQSTHPPGGDPRNQSKFNSTWTNRDISIPFEDLKSVETSPPMGGCVVWWVGGWVDGWDQVKTLKILKLLTESR